ncbi:hypothetical protein [Paraburkholderia sp. SIMBA_054]|uniref:hypothetical protein n=1 Tax=Paraburkholderia sp. SIMBA_054 TaxID=3085795 RepID=UPI003978002A
MAIGYFDAQTRANASSTACMSAEQLAQRAMSDYEQSVGKTVRVTRLKIYLSGRADYRWLSTPATVRVLETRRPKLETLSCKDLIVPEWSVELVEPHAEIPKGSLLGLHPRSFGGDGRTYPGDIGAPAPSGILGGLGSVARRLRQTISEVPAAVSELVWH